MLRTKSYETVYKRWPIILTGIIDTIYHEDHNLGVLMESGAPDVNSADLETKITEGKAIIGEVSRLKYDMARDRPLEYALCFMFPCCLALI